MASRRAAQRGTLLLTLQTSQPFLARSELVNKDLDAALSKNYPGSSALSRVTPGLLQGYSWFSVFIQDLGGTTSNFLTLVWDPEWLFPWGLSLQEWEQLQEPTLSPCHLPHVPNVEVAISCSKDKAISASSPAEAHPGHHLRTEVGVSAPTSKNWEKQQNKEFVHLCDCYLLLLPSQGIPSPGNAAPGGQGVLLD